MTEEPLVFVVVLNWNGKDDTLNCLISLEKLNYTNLEIVLVDNGSSDGTTILIQERMPHVKIIENEINLGFAKGVNIGIYYALQQGAEYILILNNDTTIDSDALLNMMKYTSVGVGIIAPLIYYDSERSRIWSSGGMKHPLTYEKITKQRKSLSEDYFNQAIERDYLVGCAMLLSKKLIQEIGGFDERFFMYYEDSDMSLRARNAGYKLLLVPKAVVWHKVASSSGGSDSPNERYWMARSSILFFKKHIKGIFWFVVIPYRVGSATKTVTKLIFRGKTRSVSNYLKGLWDGIKERGN